MEEQNEILKKMAENMRKDPKSFYSYVRSN